MMHGSGARTCQLCLDGQIVSSLTVHGEGKPAMCKQARMGCSNKTLFAEQNQLAEFCLSRFVNLC